MTNNKIEIISNGTFQSGDRLDAKYIESILEENDKLKAEIEQLKERNEANRHDLKLSANAQSLVNRLEKEMFSAECYNNDFNSEEVTNLLCLGNICDVLEEMCNYRR